MLTWALSDSPKKGLCPVLCPGKAVSALAWSTTVARLPLHACDSSLHSRAGSLNDSLLQAAPCPRMGADKQLLQSLICAVGALAHPTDH